MSNFVGQFSNSLKWCLQHFLITEAAHHKLHFHSTIEIQSWKNYGLSKYLMKLKCLLITLFQPPHQQQQAQ